MASQPGEFTADDVRSRFDAAASRRGFPGAWTGVVVAAAIVGCASQGIPPGGPPDLVPPALVSVSPESGAVGVTPRAVEFRFSEVISERPRGAQALEQLVVVSPADGSADVDWARDRIVVRPERGWKPNTAYTVTVLAGLSDLRSNAATRPFSTVFSTGRTIPSGVIRGVAFDWMAGRAAPGARIEAWTGGDTLLKWSIAADSNGRYALSSLPAASFLLRGWVDANANGVRDAREPWDTTTITLADSARYDVYAFPHDTVGAGLGEVTIADSMTIRIRFDHGLRPADPLAGATIRVMRASDSTDLPVLSVRTAAAYDTLARARRAARDDSVARADTSPQARTARERADSVRRAVQQDSAARAQIASVRAARDTVTREAPPIPSRPTPPTEFVIEMGAPLPEEVRLLLVAADVQALVGPPRTSSRPITRRRPVVADTAGAKAPAKAPPRPPVIRR